MRHNIKWVLGLALLVIAGGGCKKYLDVKPKGIDIPTTIDQFNGLFNNTSLISFGNYQIGAGSVGPGDPANLSIFLSDEAYTTSPYNSFLEPSYQNGYHWAADVYLPTQNAAEWSAFYEENYTYNVIANNVMNATDGTDTEKKQLLAEARANRAYLHLMLVNYFGKPYDSATAVGDPGVPIITVAAASSPAGPRATVQQVYDFVISELSAAIADLPANTINRLRLYKPAAEYMLGETYFLMGNYDSALVELKACQDLLPSSTQPMQLYDYNTVMAQWASPFPNFAPTLPIAPNNTEAICQRQVSVGGFRGSAFLDSTYDLYDSTDLRLKFFTKTDFSGTAVYPSWSRSGPYSVNIGPSMPGLYLMLAECKARQGDLAGANADVVTLREHRMPAGVADVTINDQDSLIRFIVKERYREYALTGKNWFDVRRLWNDPLFKGKAYTHTDNAGVYKLTEDRLVLKIPPLILGYNTDMPDNP